jgi:acetyl-CoA carboxylase carboxyltransferase component
MGPKGAIEILYKKEIEESEDPEATTEKLVLDYTNRFANPYMAAERGYIDDVIEPAKTRPVLIRCLEILETKKDSNPPRKHGNIPL